MTPTLSEITAWILSHRGEIIGDLFRLVRIPSISDPGSPVGPFGQACRDALQCMYDLAGRHGWTHEDFSGAVGRIGFSDVSGVPSAGIWCHLDVVPVPDPADWVYPPFQGTEVEGRCFHVMKADDDNAVIRMLEALAEVFGDRRDALLSLRDLLSSEEEMEMGVTADTFFPVSPF